MRLAVHGLRDGWRMCVFMCVWTFFVYSRTSVYRFQASLVARPSQSRMYTHPKAHTTRQTRSRLVLLLLKASGNACAFARLPIVRVGIIYDYLALAIWWWASDLYFWFDCAAVRMFFGCGLFVCSFVRSLPPALVLCRCVAFFFPCVRACVTVLMGVDVLS